jgi:hypothetical protein
MGRLNKKITAKTGLPLSKAGLSRSQLAGRQSAASGGLSTSAVLAKKDSIATLTSQDISTVSSRLVRPSETPKLVLVTSEPSDDVGKYNGVANVSTKKALRRATTNPSGGVSKKDRQRIRSELLHKRLAAAETVKQAAKAKKRREKAVIVKDLQPLIEDLNDIEEDIKKVKGMLSCEFSLVLAVFNF